jgi:iron complex outermembrane receptor protein
VTSVSRRPEALSQAAAAIYVISGENLRRSGALTLPEALRLAPNLEVAALDARQYAISARGFLSNIANKLLVLIDGRTVYSPLFSGVFWDAQDLLLDDVDRIEVISGPGGVTWGTNAVNGIINVITKSADETQGVHARGALGDREGVLAARWGTRFGDTALRVYAKRLVRERSEILRPPGPSFDAWGRSTAGVRADWSSGADALMLEGEAWRGASEAVPLHGAVSLSGGYLLARWQRRLADGGDVEARASVDHTRRDDRFLLQEHADIADLEVKRRLAAGRHQWVFGASLRHASDTSEPGDLFAFIPADRSLNWYAAFAQDQWRLADALELTLGLRLEHNPYSGLESLPSLRVGWNATPRDLLWASLSRAVRSPARLDREIFFPATPPFFIAGGPNFDSEIANVLELGYRGQPAPQITWSLTGFVNDFDRLRSGQFTPQGTLVISNLIAGQVRGIEAWGEWQPASNWRLGAGLLLLDKNLHLKAGSNDPVGPSNLGDDPRAQWSLRSLLNLSPRHELDLALRHVGALPQPLVPSYTALDARLGWRIAPGIELSLVVRNALDAGHVEFDPGATATEQRRSATIEMRWSL